MEKTCFLIFYDNNDKQVPLKTTAVANDYVSL